LQNAWAVWLMKGIDTMNHIDTMRLALDALDKIETWSTHTADFSLNYGSNGVRDFYRSIAREAIAALQAALAEPSAPVAYRHWSDKWNDYDYQTGTEFETGWEPLYLHPPVPPSPLTDEEILAIERDWTGYAIGASDAICFARAIEAAIRGKT
jgi:hypothetical protein